MPPAMLHHSVISRFALTVNKLLEQGQTVKVCALFTKDFHIWQNRCIVTLIASHSQTLANVPILRGNRPARAEHQDPGTSFQGSLPFPLETLNFQNARAGQDFGDGFLFSNMNETNPTTVYNHKTGRLVPEGKGLVLAADASEISVSGYSSQTLLHPSKYFDP